MTEKEFNEKHKDDKVPEKLQNLINEAVKSAKLTLNQYELEFNKVQKRFENYNRVQGIVSPLNTVDFFSWIAMAYPDDNLPKIIEVAKHPNSYKRYHEYQMRLNDIPDWSKEKEFEYLQKEITEPHQSKTAILIYNLFEVGTKNGWQDIFNTESDYQKFVGILTEFFEFKRLNIDNIYFKMKRNTKTKAAAILREVHKDLSEKQLKSDIEFFKIVRLLNHFQNEPDINIYKALIK